jgi:hypothetical protein
MGKTNYAEESRVSNICFDRVSELITIEITQGTIRSKRQYTPERLAELLLFHQRVSYIE